MSKAKGAKAGGKRRGKKVPPELVKRAALLRVAGKTWPEVSEALDRAESALREWPNLYPELWQEATEAAGQSLLGTFTDLALAAAKRQDGLAKNDPDHHIRQSANHSLMVVWAKLMPQNHFISTPKGAKTYEDMMAELEREAAAVAAERKAEEKG